MPRTPSDSPSMENGLILPFKGQLPIATAHSNASSNEVLSIVTFPEGVASLRRQRLFATAGTKKDGAKLETVQT